MLLVGHLIMVFVLYDLVLAFVLDRTAIHQKDVHADIGGDDVDDYSGDNNNTARYAKANATNAYASDESIQTTAAAADTWQERVAYWVHGRLWVRRSNDGFASRSIMAWFILTLASIRVQLAVYSHIVVLIPIVLQTYVMQLLYFAVESYCGILRPQATLVAAIPYLLFSAILLVYCVLYIHGVVATTTANDEVRV